MKTIDTGGPKEGSRRDHRGQRMWYFQRVLQVLGVLRKAWKSGILEGKDVRVQPGEEPELLNY